MHTSIVNTYACNPAIIASKPIIATINTKGINAIIIFFFDITKVKLANIANKVWPDIMLANSRIAKLKGLEK